MRKNSARSASVTTPDLSDFFARYGAVLEAVARRVHALRDRGVKFTPTLELASWVSRDLPALYARTFGREKPKRLKAWRVCAMLSAASYLGAYDALDIRCVRGRGVTTGVAPKKRARLTVIEGGKKKAG